MNGARLIENEVVSYEGHSWVYFDECTPLCGYHGAKVRGGVTHFT